MPLPRLLSLSPTFLTSKGKSACKSAHNNNKQDDRFESTITTRHGTTNLLMTLPSDEAQVSSSSGAQNAVEKSWHDLPATLTASRCYDDDGPSLDLSITRFSSEEEVEREVFLSGVVRDLDTGVQVAVAPGLREEVADGDDEGWAVVSSAEQGEKGNWVEKGETVEIKAKYFGDEKSVEDWEKWWREMAGSACLADGAVGGKCEAHSASEGKSEQMQRPGDERSVEGWKGWWRRMAEAGGL